MNMSQLNDLVTAAASKPKPAGKAVVRFGDGENDMQPVGFWRDEWSTAPAGSWIARSRDLFGQAMRFAQKQVDGTDAVKIARSRGEKSASTLNSRPPSRSPSAKMDAYRGPN